MKIYRFIALAGLCLGIFSCSLDTYDLPKETLVGKLVDPEGNPLITEQPNGFKIEMYENGSDVKFTFWGKSDGTFRNTKIFKAKYTVQPVEGAFFPVDLQEVNISGVTTVNFVVIPYLYVDATIVADGSNIKATYKITQSAGAGKIQMARLLVSKWNPNLGMNYMDSETKRDLTGFSDAVIVNNQYTDYVNNILVSGVTYYARVAVLASNTSGRYNFSPVVKIVVP